MVDRQRLYLNFLQSCNSCVLASYAVGAYAFTAITPDRFFIDYCEHYKISIPQGTDAEHCYDDHFQKEWKKRGCKGFEIIQELHRSSDKESFVKCGEKFDVEFINSVESEIERLKATLTQKEALVIVAFQVPSDGVHATIVGFDGNGWYTIETRQKIKKTGPVRVSGIFNLGGKPLDGLLLTKR